MDKGGDIFLDQLARLGVISKVSTLAGPSSDDENEEESKPEKVSDNNCGSIRNKISLEEIWFQFTMGFDKIMAI